VTGFRIAALALPAAAAFLAPALWAWRSGWKTATLGHAALLAVFLLWGLLGGASGAALLAVAAMSTAFALFALGLHLAAGQLVSGFAVVLVSATLFLAPSVVEDSVSRGQRDLAQSRLNAMLSVNPWCVLAAGPFKLDLLRDLHSMYRSGVADYVEARPPAWGGVAAGYAAAGILLGAAALGVRRLRRPQSTIRNPQSAP
jgi:hypothetical protein